jgi:universal stress protein A
MKTEVTPFPETSPGKDQRSLQLPWKKILAPIDLSDPSKCALKTAAALAQKYGAKLVLLHVVQLPKYCSFDAPPETDEMMDLARKSLNELAQTIPADIAVEKIVRFALQPSEEIVEVTNCVSADLIVMATHGEGRLKRVLLGSTTERVIRHAHCPVLVVRLTGGSPQRTPSSVKEPSNPFRKN